MKKIRTLGIVTMVTLILVIGAVAALAAFGVFETTPEITEENSGVTVEPQDEESSALDWQTFETAGDITAAIKTDLGDIVIKLGDCAAAEKFIELDNSGTFGNGEFLTIVKNMFIQSGTYGEGFAFEETDFVCVNGAVGFVIHEDKAYPNFVIITADDLSLEFKGKVLVFGQVISGMDTVYEIASGENSGYAGGSLAAEPVKINDIEISYPTETNG